ncbi:MAG: HAD family hydrolase [Defluviitaleaceae bacterium]|nr:HAD family hydrolase [Defluviitaleaceae bacterium]
MNIKMIVTDLDGTLLRNDKTVSERNKQALLRCRNLGLKVAFATARSYRTKIVPQDWFDGYVCCNGAYAYAGTTLIYQRTFSNETTRFIIDACNQQGIIAEPRWDEEVCLPDMKPGDAEYIRLILPTDLYLVITEKNYGQIMHKEATKSKAIEALARHWEVDKINIAAFGDDLNDIDILSWAGIGIVMGNAVDELVINADEVCLSNEDDGVAMWIKENVFSAF